MPCLETDRGKQKARQEPQIVRADGGGEGGDVSKRITWVCGLTTVPKRRKDILPTTLRSLKNAGFPDPVLFVDGIDHREALDWEQEFDLPVVNRNPTILTFGNWVLGLGELYIRNPLASRYAMFQDDFVCSRNLRPYLDQCPFPDRGYLNLYTFDQYWRKAPRDETARRERKEGWYRSTQQGLGAVALVFDREGVWDLLTHKDNIVTRPAHAGERRWRNIDGGIVDAMKKQGRYEFVHNPSLVQHTGMRSTMGSGRHPTASSFRGEEFDCLSLLSKASIPMS